jgi:hypothetical protein
MKIAVQITATTMFRMLASRANDNPEHFAAIALSPWDAKQ